MNWNVVSRDDVEASGRGLAQGLEVTTTPDDYLERVRKLIPAELVGGYLVVNGALNSLADKRLGGWLLLAALLLGTAGTHEYVRLRGNVRRGSQRLFSMFAFATWVAAIGGWFATLGWWNAAFGTIAVVIFAVAVAIYRPKALPKPQT